MPQNNKTGNDLEKAINKEGNKMSEINQNENDKKLNPQELEDATGGYFLEDIIDTITTPIRKIVEPLKPSGPMAPLPFPQDRRGNKP